MDDARTGKRFPVQLPIRLKGAEKEAEPAGSTDNISAAGVYLVVDQGLDAGSEVSFEMVVPAEAIGAPTDITVRCQGHVLRVDPKGHGQNGVACVIDSYEFVREGEDSEAEC